jgi:hypothetical protein
MGKLTTYILVLTGTFILLHITGIIGAGEGSILLNVAMNPSGITTTQIYILAAAGIVSVLGAVGFLAITMGRILQYDLIAASALSFFLLSFIQDIIILWVKINAYSNSYLASLIISPFVVLFPIICFEFWRGREA